MNDLVLHAVTRRQVDDFIKAPAHAVMLIAPSGGGKRTLAVRLSETVIGLPAGGFENYPYKLIATDNEGKAIGIETIRKIENFLSLKVPGSGAHDRAIIIENAHL